MNKNKTLIKLGFTLIEVMVTMSIISLLSSVVFSSVKSSRTKAVDTATESQAGQFRNGLNLYKLDNGSYPSAPGPQTVSLSGREFNVACLGTGCLLDSVGVNPLPPGTLSKYINDRQETIAPSIEVDGKVQKGIFLVTCANSSICGDEAYVMSTQNQTSTGACSGNCIVSGPGGSLVISNVTTGSQSVAGGVCTAYEYNSTTKAICESHGICDEPYGVIQSECGTCSNQNYSTSGPCENAGYCPGTIYWNESDCTAITNGYCSGTANSSLGGTQPSTFHDQASCNGSGICADGLGVMNQSQYYNNQSACLDIDNGKCFGLNYFVGSWEELGGYNQSECTGPVGNYTDREWRGNQWLSYDFVWKTNLWVDYGYIWTPGNWMPAVWTPTQ